jgi:hypothetical protein
MLVDELAGMVLADVRVVVAISMTCLVCEESDCDEEARRDG